MMKRMTIKAVAKGRLKPTKHLAPKLSEAAHNAIRKADNARAEIARKAQNVRLG